MKRLILKRKLEVQIAFIYAWNMWLALLDEIMVNTNSVVAVLTLLVR